MILIPMIKYIFIVLLADNNGDGGTFALYTLISRYAKVSLIRNEQVEDAMLSNYKLETVSPQMKRAQWIKRKLEGSIVAKYILFLLTVLGTSMVIGDSMHLCSFSGTIAGISIAILVVLFSVQRFRTDKVGYSFAPIILLWFLLLGGIGLYNLIHYNAHVLHAFNPKYIFDYFKRNGKQGWVSVGGVVLCITGSEAMFADLGHFNVRAILVMASKTKIYIVLEYVTGGELFNKIASRGRLKEDEAHKYFQELINVVDYCHSRGVFHRDLKPENLLLDASGTLKVSDFGLSSIPQQVHEMGNLVVERRDEKPTMMNTFDFIATSQGLNLGILFEKEMITFLFFALNYHMR